MSTPTPPTTETQPAALDGENGVEAYASAIRGAGLAVPAAVALQIFKPLAWLGGQVAWAAQPFFEGTGFGRRSPFGAAGIARFLEKEGNVESLIQELTRERGSS